MNKSIDKALDGAVVFGCVMVAGFVTRQLLERTWEAKTDRPAPKNPAAPDVEWQEALLWGGTAGIMAGLVRTLVRKGYSKLTGNRSTSEA